MKLTAIFSLIFVLPTIALAEYHPSEPWTTLKPTAPIPTGALTSFSSSFGIAPFQVTDQAALASISSAASATATTTLASSSTVSSSGDSIPAATSTDYSKYFTLRTVKQPGALELNLDDTILTDGFGRIGAIVANRQFQFDGPPPQAGTIYAAGWSVTLNGTLAIGDNDVFFQCLSGTFYNLYDKSLGSHCNAVFLRTVAFV